MRATDETRNFWEMFHCPPNTRVCFHFLFPTIYRIPFVGSNMTVFTDDEKKMYGHYFSQCPTCNVELHKPTEVRYCTRIIGGELEGQLTISFGFTYICKNCDPQKNMNSSPRLGRLGVDEINAIMEIALKKYLDRKEKSLEPKDFCARLFESVSLEVTNITSNLSRLDRICNHCAFDHARHKCSKCNLVRYCNSKCQLADWNNHKTFCKQFSKDPQIWFLNHCIAL